MLDRVPADEMVVTPVHRDSWEKIWTLHQDHWFHGSGFREAVLAPLRGRLDGSMAVLDAGCGSGQYLRDLRRMGVRRALGIDIAFAPLLRAGEATVCQGSLEHLPFRTAALDVACCVLALEHVPDDLAVLRELHRTLRQGGLTLIVVPRSLSLVGFYIHVVEPIRKRLRTRLTVMDLISIHRTYALRQLTLKASAAGFRIVHHHNLSLLEHVGPRPLRRLMGGLGRLSGWPRYFGDELVVLMEKAA